jgi:hypothetical protein
MNTSTVRRIIGGERTKAQGGAWGNACICPPTLRRGHSGSATEKRLGRPWGGVKVYRSVGDAEGHQSHFYRLNLCYRLEAF